MHAHALDLGGVGNHRLKEAGLLGAQLQHQVAVQILAPVNHGEERHDGNADLGFAAQKLV